MRTVYPFNADWLLCGRPCGSGRADDLFEKMTLPHTNRLFTHRNVETMDYQFISTYRKHFDWTPDPASRSSSWTSTV